MKRVLKWMFAVLLMVVVAMICLLISSGFTYIYKWQADKAMVGITVTYILTGFVGGYVQRFFKNEARGRDVYSIGQKMLDGICVGAIFLSFMILISVFVVQNPFVISSRFLMIGMLLIGSACLGRIL